MAVTIKLKTPGKPTPEEVAAAKALKAKPPAKAKPPVKKSRSKASAEPLPFSLDEPGHKVRKTHLMSLLNIGRDTVAAQIRSKDIPEADGQDRQGYFWFSEHIKAVLKPGETPKQRMSRIRQQDMRRHKETRQRNRKANADAYHKDDA